MSGDFRSCIAHQRAELHNSVLMLASSAIPLTGLFMALSKPCPLHILPLFVVVAVGILAALTESVRDVRRQYLRLREYVEAEKESIIREVLNS